MTPRAPAYPRHVIIDLVRRAMEWRLFQRHAGPGFEDEARNAKRRLDYHLRKAEPDPIAIIRFTVEIVGTADLVREIYEGTSISSTPPAPLGGTTGDL